MTLLDDYRSAVYAQARHATRRRTNESRARHLSPLPRSPSARDSARSLPTSPPSSPTRARHSQTTKRAASVKLETLSPAPPPPNQVETPDARPPPSRLGQLTASVVASGGISALFASTSESAPAGARLPAQVPLQFLQRPRVDLSRWSVLVTDITLARIAAHNRRIVASLRRRQLGLNDAGQQLEPGDLPVDDTRTRALLLNNADRITDAGLLAIAEAVPTLEVLELHVAVRITDAGLRALAMQCPALRRLHLGGCTGIRGAGLGAIADKCLQVRELVLPDCAHLGDWVLRRCVYAFASLERLDLARCRQVTDDLLSTVATQCRRHLRVLILSDCDQVSDAGVVAVAQHCARLEEIAIDRTLGSNRITDTAAAALGEHCPRLTSVRLAGCNFLTDVAIQWLAANCHDLEHLDLTDILYVTDVSARALGSGCPKLRSLKLTNVKNVSDVGLRLLATGCPNLEALHLNNLYLVSDGTDRDFALEGLRAVAAHCSHLLRLDLSGCFQLVERALVAIGNGCHQLRKLSLRSCPRVSRDAIIAVLRGCPSLAALDLSGVRSCDDAVLASIGTHGTALVKLRFAECGHVSDAGLRHLAASGRAASFELLDFSQCPRVSDSGVIALIDGFHIGLDGENHHTSPALMHLFLVGCPLITQDAVVRLAAVCPLLLTLSLHGCRVSPRLLVSLSFSWPFGVVRVPAALSSGASDFGVFPGPRARDKHFMAEFAALWTAALTIQNLYRSRVARRRMLERREEARREWVARRLQSMWRGRQARRAALLRRVIQSGREKAAIRIQRRYRDLRARRKGAKQQQTVLERELERSARLVQRRFRAVRAARLANRIVATRRRQLELEHAAATQIQRRFRSRVARREFWKLIKAERERFEQEQEATVRIQAIIRGRADRKRAREQELAQQILALEKERLTIRLQAAWRRKLAYLAAQRRQAELVARDQAAKKLQSAFRARKAREAAGLLRLARDHTNREQAAVRIQKRWRSRNDRVGLAIIIEVRRRRAESQHHAATFLQQAFRRFLLRLRARKVMDELLMVERCAMDMENWAATLVQCHWRRRLARRELAAAKEAQRSRWKQLVDHYNHHGCGFGAPFYYNQVSGEIRWRMPRELLMLVLRPGCNQCETPESASVECATCVEYFCSECDEVVHGHGKRQQHMRRRLFNYYRVRCDYGDGEFPSVWPSEMDQDSTRGYDFVNFQPTDGYDAMLAEIAAFQPVTTGNWNAVPDENFTSTPDSTVAADNMLDVVIAATDVVEDVGSDPHVHLFNEQDFDESGTNLWEGFFDYAQQKYRYYHRLSKRVVDELPSTATT